MIGPEFFPTPANIARQMLDKISTDAQPRTLGAVQYHGVRWQKVARGQHEGLSSINTLLSWLHALMIGAVLWALYSMAAIATQ